MKSVDAKYIENTYCSEKLAKLLKTVGFNYYGGSIRFIPEDYYNPECSIGVYSPQLYIVEKWLREQKNIHIVITYGKDVKTYTYIILNYNECVNNTLIGTKNGFDTYESALEDALVWYFENCENINKQENCMMKTFLIAFQENKGYNRYDVGTDDFFEKIREIDSNYFLLFDNIVYIRTEYGAAEIYKRLAPTLGMNYVNAYGLLVQEVNTDVDINKANDKMFGDQQYDFWKWIKQE